MILGYSALINNTKHKHHILLSLGIIIPRN